MALETLKDVNEIDGFPVTRMDLLDGIGDFITIDDKDNSIAFKIQNGPIKEVGVNGCQVDTLVMAALFMLDGLNSKFPCVENMAALRGLDDAIYWLRMRKSNREKRNVEGFSKE